MCGLQVNKALICVEVKFSYFGGGCYGQGLQNNWNDASIIRRW
jgi:hypothetical protein